MKIMKLFLALIIIFTFLAINLTSFVCAEDGQKTEKVKINKKAVKKFDFKSFNLRPGDFNLLTIPEFKNDKGKLRVYGDAISNYYMDKPDVFSVAVEYGLILTDLGEYDRAEKIWDKAVMDFGINPAPKVYKGWIDAWSGNYLASKEAWLPVAKSKLEGVNSGIWLPYHTDAVIGLSIIKDYLPEKDKAEIKEAVDEISKHFANNPKFAAVLISSDLKNGDIKTAGEKIKNILAKEPDDALTITLLATVELMKKNYLEALKQLEKAGKFNPFSPTNHFMKARCLLAINKQKEALDEINEVLKLDPNWNLAILEKGKILAKT